MVSEFTYDEIGVTITSAESPPQKIVSATPCPNSVEFSLFRVMFDASVEPMPTTAATSPAPIQSFTPRFMRDELPFPLFRSSSDIFFSLLLLLVGVSSWFQMSRGLCNQKVTP